MTLGIASILYLFIYLIFPLNNYFIAQRLHQSDSRPRRCRYPWTLGLLLVVRIRYPKESLSFTFSSLLDSSVNVNAFFLCYLLSAAPESEISGPKPYQSFRLKFWKEKLYPKEKHYKPLFRGANM